MTVKNDLETASEIVRNGGVVIVPTETFYALAADPFQPTALQRIYEIKGRPDSKPLPLIACNVEEVLKVVGDLRANVRCLMERFWPGSLTILLEPVKKPDESEYSELITGAGGKIGVRVPPRCAALELACCAGGWITATSANVSGESNPREIAMISESVINAVDLVLDMGPTPGGLPSTVVEPIGPDIRIVRSGAVSALDIRNCYRNDP